MRVVRPPDSGHANGPLTCVIAGNKGLRASYEQVRFLLSSGSKV
jgi:hypothetical protein